MRRRSEAHEKAESAKVLAEAAEPTAFEPAPVDAATEAGAVDDPGLEGDGAGDLDGDAPPDQEPPADDGAGPQDPTPEPKDEDAPRAAPVMAPERKRPGVLRAPAPKMPEPNRPSFDWSRGKDGNLIPNLRQGEEITDVLNVGGIEVVRTSCTRFIYLCTAKEYEQKVDELIPRETFRACFPHAFE